MTQTLHSILAQSKPGLPVGLSLRILSAIDVEADRQARFRARLASWSAFSSVVVFLVNLIIAGQSFISSDFWQIATLLFSDLSLVLAYSEEFLLSLLETFPAASASLLLAPLFVYVISLAFRSKYLALATGRESLQFNVAHS